jgi:hypothetical protein
MAVGFAPDGPMSRPHDAPLDQKEFFAATD